MGLLLQREGWRVNHKLVYRLYQEEGLGLRRRRPRRRVSAARRENVPAPNRRIRSRASSAGRTLTREQLLARVCNRAYDEEDRSIDVYISSLRRKLGDHPRTPRFIKTVRSSGYIFLDQAPPKPARIGPERGVGR